MEKRQNLVTDEQLELVRFRSAAGAAEKAGHRTDRALPQKQQDKALSRWKKDAAIQTPLDRGANQCLARSIPPLAGPSSASALHLLCLLLYRLPLHYPEAVYVKRALA